MSMSEYPDEAKGAKKMKRSRWPGWSYDACCARHLIETTARPFLPTLGTSAGLLNRSATQPAPMLPTTPLA
jgi:hypothetical protein